MARTLGPARGRIGSADAVALGRRAAAGHQLAAHSCAHQLSRRVHTGLLAPSDGMTMVAACGAEPALALADAQPFDDPGGQRTKLVPTDADHLRAVREVVGGDAVPVAPVVAHFMDRARERRQR